MNISYALTHTALGFATIKFNSICVSQFVALQGFYHDDIAIFSTFSFLGWIFGNPGWQNTRPLRACVYASIRQRFRTVQATGYRSAQEEA